VAMLLGPVPVTTAAFPARTLRSEGADFRAGVLIVMGLLLYRLESPCW
jgi:hypothetical protein